MECRQSSPPWTVFPDPQQTPDAHEATRGTLYGCFAASLVFGLFLLWMLCERPFALNPSSPKALNPKPQTPNP